MSFPDADQAVASQEKICDYLLNRGHSVGGPKAEWLASLGYTASNWQDLHDDLLQIAHTCEEFCSVPSAFGVKSVTKGRIGRDGHRNATVVAVWMIEGNSLPRLITAYPGDDS